MTGLDTPPAFDAPGREYQRLLGDELRKLRIRNGWTREDLRDRLPTSLGVQTLATYELGTRHCTVVRLVELCETLGEEPHTVLARVHHHSTAGARARVRLNLHAVIADTQPRLAPLRRWARATQRARPEPHVVHLDQAAVDSLARLCHTPPDQLRDLLRAYQPAPPRPR